MNTGELAIAQHASPGRDRLLHGADKGDHPDAAAPLRNLVETL